MENNRKYKLTNSHNIVTIVETKNRRVCVVEGFSTGDAGSIKEFMKFVVEQAKAGEPIKIEELPAEKSYEEISKFPGTTVKG